jgi:hypothetical protein
MRLDQMVKISAKFNINGRTGRIVNGLYLARQELLPHPA